MKTAPPEIDKWIDNCFGEPWEQFKKSIFENQTNEWTEVWNTVPGINAASIIKAAKLINFSLTIDDVVAAVVKARLLE